MNFSKFKDMFKRNIKTILISSLVFIFAGTLSVFATWPTTPTGETFGGWLGEVFDLGNSTSTKIILKNTTTMGIGNISPDGNLKLDVEGRIGASEYCDQNGANCKTANLITTGPGTTNYLTKWTGATTQGNSIIYQNGTDIGIGDSTPDGTLKLDVAGQIGATAYCDQNGANCKTVTSMGGGSFVTEKKTCTNINYSSGDGDPHPRLISCNLSCSSGYYITSCFSVKIMGPTSSKYPEYVSITGNSCTAYATGYDQQTFTVEGTLLCGRIQ